VAGLDDDLGLSDHQYNMALTIFFFPYALFEVPSNIVLKLLTPRIWLTTITVAWGIVMTLMGIVQNYPGLLAARFMLGVAEAGFFPAATYLLTTFYCRFDLQKRLAIFYTAASAAGAFSGLLAFALQEMDGIGNLEGWRW
jgi:MFS family permease